MWKQVVKGHQSVYVDNVGHIREIISQTDPRSGHNVYLTSDRHLQKGIYHLMEQQLALKTDSAACHEARIYETFRAARAEILEALRNELYSSLPTAQCQLPEELAGYMFYVASFLAEEETGILEDKN